MRNVSLRSSRLALDAPCANDVAAMVDACRDPEIPRWTGAVPDSYEEDDALEFIEGVVAPGWKSGSVLTWAFHIRNEADGPGEGTLVQVPRDAADQVPGEGENVGLFAGLVSLSLSSPQTASMGVWTARAARGGGYTAEACELVLDFAFGSPAPQDPKDLPSGLGLTRVEWRAMVGNIPSARLAQRLGFSYEGLSRRALSTANGRLLDVWIAGLLAEDSRDPVRWPEHFFEN
ncbi:GNAT family N-acetyltransferase [Rothia uropygialis]|uniref:GNAT family N-acetyltransferase n=1 Tax=Kocuria sp. 36 TaxID=1415402 RepID=UPI00101C665C|nr:GNAT family protein [Kocuria sp. 36]